MAAPSPTPDQLARADAAARVRALDVRRSFLVQAPAGSGKTGLLIQRVLALLAEVERPEQILAMTFTRKAAAEMRERVLAALQEARAETPVAPDDAHGALTRALALRALAQDARRDWQLLAHPARLKMLTIDAVSAGFARQAPLTTGLGCDAGVRRRRHRALSRGGRRRAGRRGGRRSGVADLPRAPRQRRDDGRRPARADAGQARSVAARAAR